MKFTLLLFVLFAIFAITVSARSSASTESETETETSADEQVDAAADAQLEAAAADEPSEADLQALLSSTAPAPSNKLPQSIGGVTGPKYIRTKVLQPPRPIEHLLKPRGNFSHRPLLDNGREYLAIEPKRKWTRDVCNGCPIPEKIDPIDNPHNVVVRDRHGELIVVKHKKKKMLPVQPELRRRLNWEEKKWLRQQKRLFYLKYGYFPDRPERHFQPKFYPNKLKWSHKPDREHHRHLVKRLPHVPRFYPKPERKRIYRPKKGWPKFTCEKPCVVLPRGEPVPQSRDHNWW